MKRIAIPAFVAVVSLLTLPILATAQSEGENLLCNGSFEILDGNGSPVNWWLSVPEMQGTIDTDVKHHGKQSFKIVGKGVTKQYAGLMHEPLQLDGPASYRFSGWLKAEDLFTTDSGVIASPAPLRRSLQNTRARSGRVNRGYRHLARSGEGFSYTIVNWQATARGALDPLWLQVTDGRFTDSTGV